MIVIIMMLIILMMILTEKFVFIIRSRNSSNIVSTCRNINNYGIECLVVAFLFYHIIVNTSFS